MFWFRVVQKKRSREKTYVVHLTPHTPFFNDGSAIGDNRRKTETSVFFARSRTLLHVAIIEEGGVGERKVQQTSVM